MASHLSLAEETGRSPDYVLSWLKRHGYGGKPGAVTSAAEQRFRKDHPVGPSPFDELARLPPPPPEHTRLKAVEHKPSRAQLDVGQENYYKKRHDDLVAAMRSRETEAAAARTALTAAEARLAQLEARLAEQKAPSAARRGPSEGRTLRQALEGRGVAADDLVEALADLLSEPEAAAALLDGARLADEGLLARLAPICPSAPCQEVARSRGLVRRPAAAVALCAICHGSDNRRGFALMLERLRAERRLRLVVVGGSDDTHAELSTLAAEAPDLRLTLVAGDLKTSRQQAKSRVSSADVVVIWAGSILDHAVSDVFKEEADASGRVLRVMVPDGSRGIARMAQTVAEATARARVVAPPAQASKRTDRKVLR